MSYNPRDHYWIVAGDPAHVFSSARHVVVALPDAGYAAFEAAGGVASRIASLAELYDVLLIAAPDIAAASGPALVASGGLQPQQAAAVLLAAGLSVTSTATAALNGVYPVDAGAQQKIMSIATGIAAGKGLPGGSSTVGFADLAGTAHLFLTADFLNFAAAIEDYVYQVFAAEAALLAGHATAWPPASATIA